MARTPIPENTGMYKESSIIFKLTGVIKMKNYVMGQNFHLLSQIQLLVNNHRERAKNNKQKTKIMKKTIKQSILA